MAVPDNEIPDAHRRIAAPGRRAMRLLPNGV